MPPTTYSRDRVFSVVQQEVATVLGTQVDDIEERTDLIGEYHVDSLEVMEIGTRLEKALGFQIGLEDVADVRTVGQVVDNLCRRSEAT